MFENCGECLWHDGITGACTNDSVACDEGSAFVQELCPEDMFKALYMLIYSLGGDIDFRPSDLDKFDDTMKILPGWDPKQKRYTLKTSHSPPKPKLSVNKRLKVPRRKKLIIPRG